MAKFDKLAVMAKIGQTGMVPVFYHQDLDAVSYTHLTLPTTPYV